MVFFFYLLYVKQIIYNYLTKFQRLIISNDWIIKATASSPANENYGFMWWLNLNGNNQHLNNISNNAYYASGFGGNYIIIEPDYDLVIVLRWIDPVKTNEFVKMIIDLMR